MVPYKCAHCGTPIEGTSTRDPFDVTPLDERECVDCGRQRVQAGKMPELGKLVGRVLDTLYMEAFRTDPTTLFAPSECFGLHYHASIRKAVRIVRAAGFPSYRAFLRCVEERSSTRWVWGSPLYAPVSTDEDVRRFDTHHRLDPVAAAASAAREQGLGLEDCI